MLEKHLRKAMTFLQNLGSKPDRRRRPGRRVLLLESLESRDLPAPLTWAAGVNLPAAEGGIVAPPQGGGVLVLAGPTTTSYNVSVTDPTWRAKVTQAVEPLDFARTSPGVGTLPGGYVLVFGGTQNGFAISSVTQYDPNTVSVVDGVTNQTRSLRSMNTPRALLGSATDSSSGLSYAIGGQDNNGTPLATVEAYNPTTNSWTFVAPLPQTLYSASALSDGAGHLYTFGGVGASGTILNNVYRYTIATNTWDQVAPLQVGVRDSAAVLASNGLIYALGGKTAAGTTATVESYNLSTNTWTVEPSLPQPLSSEAAAVDSLGRIEVLGGYDVNGNPTAAIVVSQKLTQPDLAPTITSSPGKAAVVNTLYTYQVLAPSNPQATYTLTAAPTGMMINASTGLISWTPTYATEGPATVTVVASNSAGQSSQTYSLTVAPATPTGLTAVGISTTSVHLSWNASPDPNVVSYDIYKQYFVHSPRGSGGSYHYTVVASGITTSSATISGSGTYSITAVNAAGVQSARSGNVFAAVFSPPDLYVATTTSGADIGSLTLNVGQTGQIYLIQEFANPAPTFSVVTQPPSGGVTVNATTGLVTYTPTVADLGNQPVTFAATNVAGSSRFTFYFDVVANNPTLTVSGGPFTYDGNVHAASASALAADGVTPVAGSFALTYNGSATAPTAAGAYTVSATFTSADPSYASGTATGTLTINPATPTITVSSGPFAYDGNPHAATATAVGVDGVTPVNGTFQFTYNDGSTVPTGPGLYTLVTSFVSSDPNYASTTVTGNLIINSPGTQTPSLSLVDGSAPYDGNAHADAASAIGTGGVTPVAGSFLITYNGSAAAPTQAGTYAVVATFISSDPSYANAAIDGTLTISQVTPTLTVDPTPFVYDGTSHAALVSALGVDLVTPVNGTLSVTYNGSATPPVDAGTYDVAVTFTSNDPNYLSTSTSSTLTIQPATPSVGLGNGGQWEFTYNGQPQSVVGSAVGIDGVTPINGTFTYAYYDYYSNLLSGAPVNAGYYTFTENFTSQDPNYADGTFSWELIIYAAGPTVTVSGGPYVYNGSGQNATVSVVGIDGVTPVAGTTTFTYNGSSNAPSAAGTYTVLAAFTSSDPNYYSASGSGTLVIIKATPAFSNLSSPTVNVGATTVTVSGRLSAGSVGPGGDDVAITLNGLTQPVSISGGGNFSASFNIAGLAAGSYPITYQYLGDATRFNAAGSASSTLTVQAAPTILTNPLSQTVVSGSSVTFSVAVSGYPAPTVQWQRSTNGTTYTNISGATGLAYTMSAVTPSQNGYRYRAVVTNSAGSATTTSATLTVQYAPAVTTNPRSSTVTAGQAVTFTAAAGGNPAPTVQWQVSTNGGTTFANIPGATSTTLTLSATTVGQIGYLYRAVFTNTIGSATTVTATLTVRTASSPQARVRQTASAPENDLVSLLGGLPGHHSTNPSSPVP
jgi:N-acetylneuraminic acid mutarotase